MKKINIILAMLFVMLCLSSCSEIIYTSENISMTIENSTNKTKETILSNIDETNKTAYQVNYDLNDEEYNFEGVYVFEADPTFYFKIEGNLAYLSPALEEAYGCSGGKNNILEIENLKYDNFSIIKLTFLNSKYYEKETDDQIGYINFIKYTDEGDVFYLYCEYNPRETMNINFVKQ